MPTQIRSASNGRELLVVEYQFQWRWKLQTLNSIMIGELRRILPFSSSKENVLLEEQLAEI